MRNETKENFGPAIVLTLQALEELKGRGFRYVRVNAFTKDRRQDYMEPSYFVLIPVKTLPEDPDKRGIYEPINSQLLTDWAHFPNEGIQVLVTMA